MAFRSWRAYAERKQQLQGGLAAAVGALRNRHLAAAFHTWQEHVRGKRGAEAKLQRAVGVLRNRALAGAWEGWRLQVAVAAEHRHKVRSFAPGLKLPVPRWWAHAWLHHKVHSLQRLWDCLQQTSGQKSQPLGAVSVSRVSTAH